MIRTPWWIGALCVFVLAACSRAPEQTASGPSPEPAIASPSPVATQTMPTIRIADKHGIVSIGRGAVDPQSLHVPLFPGATQSPGIGSFSDSDTKGSTAITTLDANASFRQVDAWYKAHVPSDAQATHLAVGGESTASYEWTSADGSADRVVTINSNQGKPIITISVKILHTL